MISFDLILQLEMQLEPLVPKILLQGQRPVPYQRGPAALVAGRTKKKQEGLKARHICVRGGECNLQMGRAFSPFL